MGPGGKGFGRSIATSSAGAIVLPTPRAGMRELTPWRNCITADCSLIARAALTARTTALPALAAARYGCSAGLSRRGIATRAPVCWRVGGLAVSLATDIRATA